MRGVKKSMIIVLLGEKCGGVENGKMKNKGLERSLGRFAVDVLRHRRFMV
jgi:hypothetical protein